MEKRNKRGVIVGIFIFIALAIFIAGVLTLGGQQSLLKSSTQVKAVFDDVGGLQAGNNVWFAGVKVGVIKNISFDSNGRVVVSMNIEDRNKPYIKKDTKAKVGSDGLIGNKIIVLSGGTPNAGVIEAGDVLGIQKAVDTDEMLATLQENNKNLLAITNDVKTVSGRLASGEGSIGKLLKDETLANQLQAAMASIQRSASNAEDLTQGVAAYAAQLKTKGSLAQDLVTDTVIFARLRSVARQIDQVSAAANAVVADLKQTSQGLNAGINNSNGTIGTLLNDKQTADNLKQTIENLSAGTKKLDENLEALQHNFLLRGFFRKRAKEQAKQVKQ
ncbi:MAG TPA: MlaD family protein [Flavisolibacter sp.]|nr:MlaD family protein [Flavisolibacter sp.]